MVYFEGRIHFSEQTKDLSKNLKDLKYFGGFPHYPLYTSLCTGELNAFRKHKCFLCSPFYWKGVPLGHVGRN